MTSNYSPPPEILKATWSALTDAVAERGIVSNEESHHICLTAAVAFRHPDGHPELVPYDVHQAVVSYAIDTALAAYDQRVREGGLVPWEQVRELVDAARFVADLSKPLILRLDACERLRAALAPFTQEPET